MRSMKWENGDFLLRKLTEDDLSAFERFWGDELGFTMAVNHIRRWYLVDPEGFFGIFLENQLVATGSATKQTDGLYFVGSIGVTESQRGKGLCGKIFDRLFERCAGGCLALFAEVGSIPMYRRLGFEVVESVTASVYFGKPTILPRQARESDLEFEVIDRSKPEAVKNLVDYDARVHGYQRQIDTTLIDDDDGSVVACVRKGKVVGYARIATCRRDGGALIGPLYADTAEIAVFLVEDILDRNATQASITLYLFLSSRGSFLADELKLKKKKDAPLCCTHPKSIPAMDTDKIYGYDSINFALC